MYQALVHRKRHKDHYGLSYGDFQSSEIERSVLTFKGMNGLRASTEVGICDIESISENFSFTRYVRNDFLKKTTFEVGLGITQCAEQRRAFCTHAKFYDQACSHS